MHIPRAAFSHTLVAAVTATALAFVLYRATLLPGLDLGDTASFQVRAASPVITPRDAYPLYFALGDVVAWTVGGDPAHAFNLASALEAAIACGLVVLVAAELSGSAVAGFALAMLLAGSYTFWSQAVIAEVYALHVLLVALSALSLLWWADRPRLSRLAVFFAVYALGFGNHLSMILLAPAYATFLLLAAPRKWRDILTPRVLALAAAIALVGSVQYLWNARALWFAPIPPAGIVEGLRAFWFDVTKADWRSTSIGRIPSIMLGERLRMYWFDLGQQFGWAGPALAVCGSAFLVSTRPERAVLLLLAYTSSVLFAFSYNVGDAHVFYLSSHVALLLLAGCGIPFLQQIIQPALARLGLTRPPTSLRIADQPVALALVAIAFVRMWDNYPALDRSEDGRPVAVLSALTRGLDDRREIFLTGANWQIENGLNYFAKRLRPEVAWAPMTDVAPYAATLISDNLSVGRAVALTAGAKASLDATLPSGLQPVVDPRVEVPTLTDLTEGLAPGTRYVLCVLRPSREFPLSGDDLAAALRSLTGTTLDDVGRGTYFATAGIVGRAPALIRSDDRPFRSTVVLEGVPVDIRMESWLAFDTIRRMGFGQVVAARHHTLIVERGVSFAAFDERGRPIRSGYTAGLFAPERRYLIAAPVRRP